MTASHVVALAALLLLSAVALAAEPRWRHLSSTKGDLPVPGASTQQTAVVVADLDQSGRNGFVLGFRQKAPALVWYRPSGKGWARYVIEKEYLTIEAGGAVCDIDGDGYPDLVFGGDWQSNCVWWWRNPGKDWRPEVPWQRHTIKRSGAKQHHDQCFADFKGTGKPQLAYWNQGAKTLFVADIPANPRNPREVEEWPAEQVFSGSAGESPGKYAEGMSAYDVDGDGKPELLAGNHMFKHQGPGKWSATKIGDIGGLIFAGRFIKAAKYPQIVIAPGDGTGPVKWYECQGDPFEPKSWVGHDLVGRPMIHPHSLQVADLDGDGNLDIFVAEMAKWSEKKPEPDNPKAEALIFYGDGKGGFRRTVFAAGMGFHEVRVADFTGDGRMDVLSKPYCWETPRVDLWLQETRMAPGTSASFKGPVGLQLYSLRDIFPKDLAKGLEITRNFGIVEVELAGTYGLKPAEFRAKLEAAELKPVSTLFDYGLWEKDPEAAVQQAKELGVRYAGVAWIPHQSPFDEATARKAAAMFNRAGEVAARHGIRFFYHNHGYEFVKHGGGTLFDVLVKETRPEWVTFEMDVFWTVHPGQDPVALLRRYPTRWELFHLKDLKKGVATGKLTGSEDVNNDVPLGTGQIDLPAAIKAAQEIGVKHYFIEDESPVAVQQIPQSLRFLEKLAW